MEKILEQNKTKDKKIESGDLKMNWQYISFYYPSINAFSLLLFAPNFPVVW
jgi:hypothetical protein